MHGRKVQKEYITEKGNCMDGHKIKISVIIPAHNSEKWIGRCLESVLAQSYRNLEIVVVDDGSVDKTLAIVKSIARTDGRVRCFRQGSRGVSSARNQGLRQATGNIITFVDSDDYIEKNMYETMLAVMREQGADIVECACRHVDEEGKLLRDSTRKSVVLSGKRSCVKNCLQRKNIGDYMWNKIYKRKLFRGIQFPSLKYSEDFYVNARVYARADKVVILPDLLYNYTIHEGQATNTTSMELSNFDGVRAGRMAAEYFRKDKELRTYAGIYACEYAIRTAQDYIARYPDGWEEVRRRIGADILYCCLVMAPLKDGSVDIAVEKKRYMDFIVKGMVRNGVLVQAIPELRQKEWELCRKSRLLQLTFLWVDNLQKEKRIGDWLIEKGYGLVAVYGAGGVGRRVLAELSGTGVKVVYVIDQKPVEAGIPVYAPDDALPAVDCVIVTVVMEYKEIYRCLRARLECPIFSIEEIVCACGE